MLAWSGPATPTSHTLSQASFMCSGLVSWEDGGLDHCTISESSLSFLNSH